MKRLLLTTIAVLSGAFTMLHAAPLNGTFTLDGTVIITQSGLIEWLSNTSVASQATISSGGLTGSFIATGNQTVTINTLTNSGGAEPINSAFTNFDFINFTADPLFPELLANFIPLGSGTAANCSTNAALAVANQTCTLTPATTPPSMADGSEFTFFNTETSSGGKAVCCTSSATWNISGVTSDGQSIWSGEFNATFNTPYQTVLSNFSTNGQVSDAYSGDFTVTITAVPEPATLGYVASGLFLCFIGSRRRRRMK